MSLVLSLRAGQDFYVDHKQVVVTKVHRDYSFDLCISATGKTHHVSDEESVEVFDDVFVFAGEGPQHGLARVAIEAPAEVILLRGERYRNAPKPEPAVAGMETGRSRYGEKKW